MKVKKEFLEKVIRNRTACTKNFFYKRFDYNRADENGEFDQFCIIKRIKVEDLETLRYYDENNWEEVAQTKDGKTFTRFK